MHGLNLQYMIRRNKRQGSLFMEIQEFEGTSLFKITFIVPSLTVEKQKNGCKASKINACSRFLFRNDMCYCAIFFTLW